MANFAYLLGCKETRVAALIDPCFEPEKLVTNAKDLGYSVEWVINTLGLHDHVNGNDRAVELTDAKVAAHSKAIFHVCLLYTSPSPRDLSTSRMPSSA